MAGSFDADGCKYFDAVAVDDDGDGLSWSSG